MLVHTLLGAALGCVHGQRGGGSLCGARGLFLGLHCFSCCVNRGGQCPECIGIPFSPEPLENEVDTFRQLFGIPGCEVGALSENRQAAGRYRLRGAHSNETKSGEPALVAGGSVDINLECRIAPSGCAGKHALLSLHLDASVVGQPPGLARLGGGLQKFVERINACGLFQPTRFGFRVPEE